MKEDRAVFEAVLAAQQSGRPAALATIVQTQGSVPRQPGSKMLVWADGGIVGTVGGGEVEALVIQMARAAIQDGQTRLVSYNLNNLVAGDPGICGGTLRLFIEPLLPLPTVVVIGCGHVGKSVAQLAKWLGLRVIVSDDRPGYATPEQMPDMDGYLEVSPAELVDQLTITAQTCMVAVTRSAALDQQLIPLLLATAAPYIGLIGSRRRWALTAEMLMEQGVDPEELARVHAPIGLELKAETPKEIALSIMAEIIMVLRGGDGVPMRWMGSPAELAEDGANKLP